jgi:hypothetical protein
MLYVTPDFSYWCKVDGCLFIDLSDAESEVMKSLVFAKEKELALALMKVAELTRQLEQLRSCGSGCGTRRSMIDSPTMTGTPVVQKPIVKPTIAPPPPPIIAMTTGVPASDVSSIA